MIALVRKELRLSLDVLRPVAYIVVAAMLLGPLCLHVFAARFISRTGDTSEIFLIIGYATAALMPFIGAGLAWILTIGDERHGARTVASLLPVSLGVHAALKLVVGLMLTLMLACMAPWLGWGAAYVAELLESQRWSEVPRASDALTSAMLTGLTLGVMGFAASWGATGLGRPVVLSIGLGVLITAASASASIGLAALFLDWDYRIHDWHLRRVGLSVLQVAIAALFVAGTIPRFGVPARGRIIAQVLLAAVVLASGPAIMYQRFVRPAWAEGRVGYSLDVLAARDIWSFVDHLTVPEPGYRSQAAAGAFHAKLRAMSEPEWSAFFDAVTHEIGAATKWTPRLNNLLQVLPYTREKAPPDLANRLAAWLNDDSPPEHAHAALKQLRSAEYPMPAAIDAIERYWANRRADAPRELQYEIRALRSRMMLNIRPFIETRSDPRHTLRFLLDQSGVSWP